ncbi:dTDP-4-dehydrorhamnose 3,5-epimerase [Robiginitalea sediminis]|uniref:dTDP-4-dehydrorhamnose 3,5-epimerase n=1 Tax=Robiginitalea sediminis TaxID=1982593 RepID=UPI000B4C151C|nr:dTDP-4-dehydrorhamnose 3,5-epimerase [Robiginitalea sediminis]
MPRIEQTPLPGCFLIHPDVHEDARGVFLESFNRKSLQALPGGCPDFVQDNLSVSKKHVLRGLHYQKGPDAQAKLVRVLKGRVRDVVVDLRPGSPTVGHYFSIELSDRNHLAVFIPKGMAHGFLSLEDDTLFSYKCDAYYAPGAEAGIRYDDASLAIDWGVPHDSIILSEKDKGLPGYNQADL